MEAKLRGLGSPTIWSTRIAVAHQLLGREDVDQTFRIMDLDPPGPQLLQDQLASVYQPPTEMDDEHLRLRQRQSFA